MSWLLRGELLLDTLDLGGELALVPGADVGLENEADPRRGLGEHVDGSLHHRHDLVPISLDVGEHRVGLAGESGLAYDADRACDRLAHAAGLIVGGGRADAESDKHASSLCPRSAATASFGESAADAGYELVDGEPEEFCELRGLARGPAALGEATIERGRCHRDPARHVVQLQAAGGGHGSDGGVDRVVGVRNPILATMTLSDASHNLDLES